MQRSSLAVAASLLFTSYISAQTFEQMAGYRLPETPRSTRSAAMAGAADAAGTDVASMSDNPAAAAGLKRMSLSVSGARTSYDNEAFRSAGNFTYSIHNSFDAIGLTNISFAVPLHTAVIGLYYNNEPRFRGSEPLLIATGGDNAYMPPPC